MNLNEPVTLESIKKQLSSFKYGRAVVISSVSLLLALAFTAQAYLSYLNNQAYEEKNLEFIELNNQVNATNKKISRLLHDNANYFKNLANAPASKSELVELITNIGAGSNVVIRKIVANDNPQDQAKGDLIELEIDGRYQSIMDFVGRLRPSLSASNIELVKLEKRRESYYVHGVLRIKFSAPPDFVKKMTHLTSDQGGVTKSHRLHNLQQLMASLHKHPEQDYRSARPANLAFRVNGEDYLFGQAPGIWRFYQTGFVPKPVITPLAEETLIESVPIQQPQLNEAEQTKRADPFLPSTSSAIPPSAALHTDSSAIYLSGIVYAEHLGLCIVTLSSGESRVLGEGEAINARVRVKRVSPDGVLIQAKQDKLYKVGQEIYAK
jgi:hypothetical protein